MRRDLAPAVFEKVIALRLPIASAFVVLLLVAGFLASRIPTDTSLHRLLLPDDPATIATREFQKIFPETQVVILLLETPDPFDARALSAARAAEDAVRATGVTVYSAQSVYRRAHPTFAPGTPGADPAAEAEAIAGFRRFAQGASQLRRQGLVSDAFLGLTVAFLPQGTAHRNETLAKVDAALSAALAAQTPSPFLGVRKVGAPYVEAWLERAASDASATAFPFFGLFVIGLTTFLYRSLRALLAILASVGASVVLALGAGSLLDFAFTLVSSLVPLGVMVTTLANLVYVHSRFLDQPEDRDTHQQQVFALVNKLRPITASNIAAILGFAALAVSDIRPIFEMGVWTAIGLACGWVVTFTLFPALQSILRVPTSRTHPVRSGRIYDWVAERLPSFTRAWRVPLVVGALTGAGAGVVALFGLPGHLSPMRVSIDPMDYVDPDTALWQDMRWFRDNVAGLNVARVWVRLGDGTSATDPAVLRGLDHFTTAVEGVEDVSLVVGPTTFLRMRRYLAGGSDVLPDDPATFNDLAADVEQLLLTEQELRAFIDVGSLASAQLMVTFQRNDEEGSAAVANGVHEAWRATVASTPALKGAEMQLVGEYLLQAKAGAELVPTLAESFMITAALIFAAFFVVFRSFTARLMAIIPSVFAILVTFLGMRLLGEGLNVATILIATTVLGTTENDQIHFFYHLQEAEGEGLERSLRHSLRVSGRAIAFATLINAAGFMGLALCDFPPMRQFGVVAAAAFGLAMLADFTALPAALWILRGKAQERERS